MSTAILNFPAWSQQIVSLFAQMQHQAGNPGVLAQHLQTLQANMSAIAQAFAMYALPTENWYESIGMDSFSKEYIRESGRLVSAAQKIVREQSSKIESVTDLETRVRAILGQIEQKIEMFNQAAKDQTEKLSMLDKEVKAFVKDKATFAQFKLADAFVSVATEKKSTMRFFFCGFIFGIVLIFALPLLGHQLWALAIEAGATELSAKTGVSSKLIEHLASALLALPAIWIAWFCAKQHSVALRIREDYVFKAAIAKSFVGYKEEVTAFPDLLAKLLSSSIETFTDNPARTISKSDKHAHPAESLIGPIKGLLDKALQREAEVGKK